MSEQILSYAISDFFKNKILLGESYVMRVCVWARAHFL